MRRVVVMVTVVLLGAAGCAREPEPVDLDGGAPPPVQEITEETFAAWRDFPVTAKPRPIVLTTALPLGAGFTTDEGKMAAGAGSYRLDTQLPQGPATGRVELPDGPVELPFIPAQAAFDRIIDVPPDAKGTWTGPPLRIGRVELGTSTFHTDRGELALPAWHFHPDGALNPMSWPAIAPSAFWPSPARPAASMDHQLIDVSADGRTLLLRGPAGRSQACPGDETYGYEATATARPTAVAVTLRVAWQKVQPGKPIENCAYTAALRLIEYTVTIAEPLGNRVLIDAAGRLLARSPTSAAPPGVGRPAVPAPSGKPVPRPTRST